MSSAGGRSSGMGDPVETTGILWDIWNEIVGRDDISMEKRMDFAVCVLLTDRFDGLDSVLVPALCGIEQLPEPDEFIEYYSEFWELIEDKLDMEPSCAGLLDLIKDVLGAVHRFE